MRRELQALAAREWDVAVVGGGIHGAAVAWDAAQRGLRVALVEREDFGSGTSWNGMKTIHGGLRHLQRLDLASLRESARERRILLRIAPELVAPLGFLAPCRGSGASSRAALSLGLRLNDLLTRGRNRGLPPERQIAAGRTLGRAAALELVPGLAGPGLAGAALWHDAQVSSSERLLMGFLHAAADAGAALANHAEALQLLRSKHGRVAGLAVRDTLDGRSLELKARMVLNAAGPWADELAARGCLVREPISLLRARNLVLARKPASPLAVGARGDGRMLFLVPWQGRSIVGTAYEPAEGPASDPLAFLDEAARAFPWAGIERSQLALVHEGLVPGANGGSGLVTRSRLVDHELEDAVPGLVSVHGAKYTTARAVAERAVDLALRRLRRPHLACRTAQTVLERARPLEGTLAERVRVAVREEMALTLADAALRRLDLGTAGLPEAVQLDALASAMARELGWDDPRARAERATVAAFYESRSPGSGLVE